MQVRQLTAHAGFLGILGEKKSELLVRGFISMLVRRKQTPDLRKSWATEIFPDSRQKSGLKSTIVLRCAAEVFLIVVVLRGGIARRGGMVLYRWCNDTSGGRASIRAWKTSCFFGGGADNETKTVRSWFIGWFTHICFATIIRLWFFSCYHTHKYT